MKTIKFSEKELGFIRQQYQVELEEAEEYVENLKNILKKISSPEASAPDEAIVKERKRPGRKPKVKNVITPAESAPVEKKRKPRADKGVKRAKRAKPVTQEKSTNDTTPVVSSTEGLEKAEDAGNVLPKKKSKKNPKRRRGVFLTPMRKP